MTTSITANKVASGGSGNMTYIFKTTGPFNDNVTQTLINIPFVNTGPSNTILFRFSGKGENAGFDFPIFDDGVDAANGTAPTNSDFSNGTVITVNEQITWLKNYLFDEDFDTEWTLIESRYFPSPGVTGVIEAINFPNQIGGVAIVVASMAFVLGTIGGF